LYETQQTSYSHPGEMFPTDRFHNLQ